MLRRMTPGLRAKDCLRSTCAVDARTQSVAQHIPDEIRDAGGEIYRYDPKTGVMTIF
jgi:hypothetical protein